MSSCIFCGKELPEGFGYVCVACEEQQHEDSFISRLSKQNADLWLVMYDDNQILCYCTSKLEADTIVATRNSIDPVTNYFTQPVKSYPDKVEVVDLVYWFNVLFEVSDDEIVLSFVSEISCHLYEGRPIGLPLIRPCGKENRWQVTLWQLSDSKDEAVNTAFEALKKYNAQTGKLGISGSQI